MQCISCHREIQPSDKVVKFPCPRCGNIIIRCEKCKVLVNSYKCTCGFEGP